MKKNKLIRNYFIIIGVIAAVFTPLFLIFPELKNTFNHEGMLVELAATFLYLQVFIVGLSYILKVGYKNSRLAGRLVTALGFFGFLEETSFGRDFVYHFDRPRLYNCSIDSLHDFTCVIQNILLHSQDKIAIVILLLIFLIVAIPSIGFIKKNYKKIVTFLKTNTGFFFLVSFAALGFSALIDLHFIKSVSLNEFLLFLEELFELFAVIALLFAAVTIKKEATRTEKIISSE